jgi:hypothetical protein
MKKIMPVVVHECETFSLVRRLFENRIVRKITGPKREETTEDRNKSAYSGNSLSALLSHYHSGYIIGRAHDTYRENKGAQVFDGET